MHENNREKYGKDGNGSRHGGGRNFPRAHQSGMDLGLSRDMFDSFLKYQEEVQKIFTQLQATYGFTIVDGLRSADAINTELRKKIGAVLAGKEGH